MSAALSVGSTITDGSLVLALPLAVAAGLVSFLSPCVLPLVPGYLTYVTGLSAAEVFDEVGTRRWRLLAGATLFGVGWGLAGFCPGPALVALGMMRWKAAVFMLAMLAGMVLFELLERRRERGRLRGA